jgi:hypothetical protein
MRHTSHTLTDCQCKYSNRNKTTVVTVTVNSKMQSCDWMAASHTIDLDCCEYGFHTGNNSKMQSRDWMAASLTIDCDIVAVNTVIRLLYGRKLGTNNFA